MRVSLSSSSLSLSPPLAPDPTLTRPPALAYAHAACADDDVATRYLDALHEAARTQRRFKASVQCDRFGDEGPAGVHHRLANKTDVCPILHRGFEVDKVYNVHAGDLCVQIEVEKRGA